LGATTTAALTIAVIGGGSWGTALAKVAAEKGHAVRLWIHEHPLVAEVREKRENSIYLPGVRLPETISPTNVFEEAVSGADMVLWVVPSHVTRRVLEKVSPLLSERHIVVCATKGVENETLLPMSDVLKTVLPGALHQRLAFLSGPTFAKEVAANLPTAATAAAFDESVGRAVQDALSGPSFRLYTNSDVMGVELAGAIKNVIAIAAGISDGLGFGNNARAALITRGLAEITRLGVSMGAQPATFAGLAGMGDLVLTCTGDLSRNRTLGMRLGKGEKLKDILAGMTMVAEGVQTARAVHHLAMKQGIEMPITEQVYRILYEEKDTATALRDLMGRSLKSEE